METKTIIKSKHKGYLTEIVKNDDKILRETEYKKMIDKDEDYYIKKEELEYLYNNSEIKKTIWNFDGTKSYVQIKNSITNDLKTIWFIYNKVNQIDLINYKNDTIKIVKTSDNKINKITNYKNIYDHILHGLEIFFDNSQNVIKKQEWENGFNKDLSYYNDKISNWDVDIVYRFNPLYIKYKNDNTKENITFKIDYFLEPNQTISLDSIEIEIKVDGKKISTEQYNASLNEGIVTFKNLNQKLIKITKKIIKEYEVYKSEDPNRHSTFVKLLQDYEEEGYSKLILNWTKNEDISNWELASISEPKKNYEMYINVGNKINSNEKYNFKINYLLDKNNFEFDNNIILDDKEIITFNHFNTETTHLNLCEKFKRNIEGFCLKQNQLASEKQKSNNLNQIVTDNQIKEELDEVTKALESLNINLKTPVSKEIKQKQQTNEKKIIKNQDLII